MRVLALVHEPDAGPGVFADAIADAGHALVEWTPASGAPPELDAADALLVLGGSMHVDHEDRHPWLAGEKRMLAGALRQRIPMLGVCLGAQLLAEAAGGAARRAAAPEIGWTPVTLGTAAAHDALCAGLPRRFEAFEWHAYEALPPAGAVPLARSNGCLQAYRLDGAPAWGVQFHAEVSRRDVLAWIDGCRDDEDAVRIGVQPEPFRAETERRIEAWNELGRGLCARFLAEAERVSRARTSAAARSR